MERSELATLRPHLDRMRTTEESVYPGVEGVFQRVYRDDMVVFHADKGGGYFVSASLVERVA
jgi:hypothetical protein